MSKIEPSDEDRSFLDEVRRRHPQRTTVCGALLAEFLTGEDPSNRPRLAILLGLWQCRRGLRQLECVIADLLVSIGYSESMQASPERRLLYQILFAIGRMDTAESHSLLVRISSESKVHWIRADAIEAMAFEEEQFDFDLVLGFISEQAEPLEILSALYALQFQDYANRWPEDCREWIQPFLKHPDSMVRVCAVALISVRLSNLDLILPLKNDPDPAVRQEVAMAIESMQTFEDD